MHKINEAKSKSDIENIIVEMLDDAYVNYQVDMESILSVKNKKEGGLQPFKNIPLPTQKKLLLEILDKNQLYVNYSEIDDISHEVPEEDKIFTHNFYNKQECNHD